MSPQQPLAESSDRGRLLDVRRLLTIRRLVVIAALLPAFAVFMYGANKVLNKARLRMESSRKSVEWAAIVKDQLHEATHVSEAGSEADDDDASAASATMNRLLPDAPFVDVAGHEGSLREYRGRVVVVSMTSIGCPISKKLVPALVRLAEKFGDGNVQFLALNADGDASQSELEEHAKLLPGWRYVHDDALTRTLGARTTCETFVIDQAQTLRYRGAVDDRFDVGVSRQAAATESLSDAVVAVVKNEPVDVRLTEAPGCVLRLDPSDQPSRPPTWHDQISRFVQYNCVECHRPGQSGPFSLETYEQVVAKSAMIEYVLDEGIMPPWFADPRYGHWRNDRHVSRADRESFRQWAAADCPEGDPADAPAPLVRASGWSIRDPDLVLEATPQEIPAEGVLDWRYVPVEIDLKEDLWVSEAEIRPSEPEIVHHAMLFVEYAQDDPRRVNQTVGEAGRTGGATGFWLSYFPGRKSIVLPPGRGKLLPKNGKLYIQFHYTPNGAAKIDKTKIGLKLLPAPPERAVVTGAVLNTGIRIPANSQAEYLWGETFDEDVRLLGLMPHMHYRGAEAQVFLRHPDGRIDTLLSVPKYDFQWQVSYDFLKPVLATRGSQLIIRHVFDNRAENPRNPDPTKTLVFGNLTTDEMMIGFFDWEPASAGPPPERRTRPFQ